MLLKNAVPRHPSPATRHIAESTKALGKGQLRMGCIRIQDENREIHSADEIRAFLKPFGIWFEQWNVERGVGPDAPSEEILAAYKPEVDRLKAQGGYITADVINVTPDFPNLDAMLNKFNKEHTHAEDEVRF